MNAQVKNVQLLYSGMEFLDVVNDKDEVTGRAEKEEVYEKRLAHRIVQVLVFNAKGEMMLQLRSKNKKGYPHYWSPSAGGHVQSGETYDEAATRELEEELGVKADLKLMRKEAFYGKVFWNNLPIKKMIAFFSTRHDGPFRMEESDIEKIEFFGMDRIKTMIARGEKIHPELLFFLKKHYGF